MKKNMLALSVVFALVFAFFTALKSSAAEFYRVSESFEVSMVAVPGGVELVMLPSSTGVEGDGYRIVFQGRKHFLPEGQPLELSSGRYYDLKIARAFQTEEGVVVMTAGAKNIKVGHNSDDVGDALDLAVMPKYRSVSPPSLTASMAYGMFVITPVSIWDVIEVVFSGGEITTERSLYFQKNLAINARIPKGKNYKYISAKAGISDKGNRRVIFTSSTEVSFSSTRAVAK